MWVNVSKLISASSPQFRKAIIEKPTGSKFMRALQPYDDMVKRLHFHFLQLLQRSLLKLVN